MKKNKKVAVVYHYWAHYRKAICQSLCQQESPNPEYVLYSDVDSNSDIKTIDYLLSEVPVSEGGLRWKTLRNYWITKDIMWQSGLFRVALSKEYDVIIFLGQMYFITTWICAFLAKLSGKRVLMWTHGFIKEEDNFKGWLRSKFYKLADGMLLYGNRARNIMIEKGFSPESLYVIYNSLDYNSQKSIRESISQSDCEKIKNELFNDPDLPVLIFVGRLTPQKKLGMLLRAGHILACQGVLVNILFVGAGAEEGDLEKLANELGLEKRVRFFGKCYDEKILAKLIMASDVCVAPGEVGLTAMHSLAYGTAVITHDDFLNQMPEYEAIQEGISGLFFAKDDCEDLANKIKDWLVIKKEMKESRKDCIKIIEKWYNPEIQCKIINDAVLGRSCETFTHDID